jgi:hypothetical protein
MSLQSQQSTVAQLVWQDSSH